MLGLQSRPRPGLPAERRIARQVARRLWNGIGGRRIGLQQAVGERPIALAHAGDIVVRGARRREAEALVRVVAHQNRRVVESPGFVKPVLIVRNHPAVHDRPRHAALAPPHLHQFVGRQRAQFLQRCRASRLGELRARYFRIGQNTHVLARHGRLAEGAERAPALRDCALEQTLGQRRCAQHADRNAARGFSEDRDPFRIASERANVALNPLQGRDHVEQAVVPGHVLGRLRAQLRMREEAQNPHPISDSDQHHAALGQLVAAVDRDRRGAAVEAASVNPDQHRDAILRRFRRSPHIQVQAIFAQAAGRRTEHGLHAPGRELIALARSLPFRGGPGLAPSKIAHRRRREGNPPVHGQVAFDGPLHQTALNFNRRRRHCGSQPQDGTKCDDSVCEPFHESLQPVSAE